MNRVYMCIDLKSFYASVECQERNLDPIKTNLVVADNSRTEKTICLAVSPSLKSYGIPGRARLFEVVQKVREINSKRKQENNNKKFKSKSYNNEEILNNKELELDYIVAVPRMKLYIEYSTKIYNVYLKYLSSDDIFVYSIDEVFCDITDYLKYYNMDAKDLVTKIIKDVYDTTGITATAGIGTNLYLAKVAMDIVAKHKEANEFGVRIAELDEFSYRKLLWSHKPLTDFWRLGKGYSKKLNSYGIHTMGDIARCSIENEDVLYRMFGINAEILIDHAWGYEPCTIKDIKNYKPVNNSLSSGQVLHEAYPYNKALIVVREMMEVLSLDLVEKHLVTDKIVLTVIYDVDNINSKYEGEITTDFYGRLIPKPAHGTETIDHYTQSSKLLTDAVDKLYKRIVDKNLLIRKLNIAVINLVKEDKVKNNIIYKQLDLFNSDNEEVITKEDEKEEKNLQETIINLKKKYGKNTILKVVDLEEGATMIDRNNQIGGHKA